jgi:hypothetical protein
MKRIQFCGVSLLLLALLAVSAMVVGSPSLWPASPGLQNQAENFNLEGKITDESAGKLTVNMESNIIMHVTYDAKTGIYRKDGSAGSSKDLKVGATIKVQGELNSSGVLEAHRIDLE